MRTRIETIKESQVVPVNNKVGPTWMAPNEQLIDIVANIIFKGKFYAQRRLISLIL